MAKCKVCKNELREVKTFTDSEMKEGIEVMTTETFYVCGNCHFYYKGSYCHHCEHESLILLEGQIVSDIITSVKQWEIETSEIEE